MRRHFLSCIAALAVFIAAPIAALAGKLTNADVVKLVDAGMSEEVILSVIAKSETGFDTSPDALILLSQQKVPQKIINAMVAGPSKPAVAASASESAAETGQGLNPEEVLLLEGDQEVPMKYVIPQLRSGIRALGYGGSATYSVMKGTRSPLRTQQKRPAFIVSVPKNAQAENFITVASFAVRKNNSREVLIGGGYMSYSTGIHPDRIMPVTAEKLADQSRATKGFLLYKITCSRDLKPGEYAVTLATAETKITGWFTSGANSYFDFGVD